LLDGADTYLKLKLEVNGMMYDIHLEWPFFDPRHRAIATDIESWSAANLQSAHPDVLDDACRSLVRQLGADGWLRYAVGGLAYGGASDTIDTRTLCILREVLSRHSGLADFAFALQGLGSGAITLFGSHEQRERYLPHVANGTLIAAFALSEPLAGSDVAALRCSASWDGDAYILDGEKTWISNGGIADFYIVFARTDEAPGSRGISTFIVRSDNPGLEIAERLNVIAPHPLARLRFNGCRVLQRDMIGNAGQGFKIAMSTLDVFRSSVAAAALGLARRAFEESLRRATNRKMFGTSLADFQITQTKLAQMATDLDASALLTYRAAWMRDMGHNVTVEAAMAKMTATEHAQTIIDGAVQIHGGLGVMSGQIVERLYREIRPLRIYEGATEVQQLIIGRGVIRKFENELKDQLEL
jgi:acyl-CoA dehydrogenase